MQENKKIVFIIPYFGKLPYYFHLWRQTALFNSKFDFLFITDIPEIQAYGNIKVLSMTFAEFQKKVQSRFDFTISLENPYKLCDYKPAYGYILEDEIKNYEFWGHCDIDVLLGDIDKFINENVLEKYDKIYEHGHMTLYRNTEENNRVFMNQGEYPEYNYQEVYQSRESYYYDEYYGMMLKSRRMNINTYLNPKEFFDVRTNCLEFVDVHDDRFKDVYFELSNGCIWAKMKDTSISKEIAYVHFQKRKMNYSKIDNLDNIMNTPIYIHLNEAEIFLENKKMPILKSKLYKVRSKYLHIVDFYKRYQLVKDEYVSIITYYKSRKKFKERRRAANILLEENNIENVDKKQFI